MAAGVFCVDAIIDDCDTDFEIAGCVWLRADALSGVSK